MESKEPAQAEVQAEAEDFDAMMQAFDDSAQALAKEEVKGDAKEEEKQPAGQDGAQART